MSANPTYSFELIDSDTMTSIESLNVGSNKNFKPDFNGPGAVSMVLRLDARAAYLVRKRDTGILVVRNDRPIWSGGITSITKSAKSGAMSLVSAGWQEELDHRDVYKAEEILLQFGTPGTIGGEIISTIIDVVNAQQDSLGNTRPIRLRFGTATDTQVRITSYKEGDNYGKRMQELIAIENGCDISVDPITKELSTRAPDTFVVRDELAFGWGTGPHNLDDAEEVDDGTQIANRIVVKGPTGQVVFADDPVAIDASGVMLEEWLSISDTVDLTVLAAYANEELVYKRYGKKTYNLKPKNFGDMPRPYDDFEWGDVGSLSVDRDAFQLVDQAVRIFSGSINVDAQGNELLSDYQVTASS